MDIANDVAALEALTTEIRALASEGNFETLHEAVQRRGLLLQGMAAYIAALPADNFDTVRQTLSRVQEADRQTLGHLLDSRERLAQEIDKLRRGRHLLRSRYS